MLCIIGPVFWKIVMIITLDLLPTFSQVFLMNLTASETNLWKFWKNVDKIWRKKKKKTLEMKNNWE
jgi:hypothetical protein